MKHQKNFFLRVLLALIILSLNASAQMKAGPGDEDKLSPEEMVKMYKWIEEMSQTGNYPEAMITVKVVGDDGNPVNGANVSIGFDQSRDLRSGSLVNKIKGQSNVNGTFSGSSKTSGIIACIVTKDEYYHSFHRIFFNFKKLKDNKWQPWNQTVDLVLKKIGQQVSMCVKKEEIPLPQLGAGCGYDLELIN
jgi:hypothetical protein